MTHGSQQYFVERARFELRLSAVTAAISCLFLFALLMMRVTPLRTMFEDPEHFGFEGPEHYVRRIELETYGPRHPSLDAPFGVNLSASSARGGGIGREFQRIKDRSGQFARGALGPGTAPNDLLARALRRSSDVPLLTSEQLVFLRLVRPSYPEEARQRGIEGRFSVLALIDTSGRVVEVQIQSEDPTGILEREAATAVLRCVIRPYRVQGTAREIVARFPFNFYLRD